MWSDNRTKIIKTPDTNKAEIRYANHAHLLEHTLLKSYKQCEDKNILVT